MKKYYLIADIGGTNTNFAILSLDGNKFSIIKKEKLPTNSKTNFNELIDEYLSYAKLNSKPVNAVFSCAGKVEGNNINLTNSSTIINVKDIRKKFNLKVKIINDFEAIAYSIEKIKSSQLKTINKGKKIKNKPKIVIGAGTGLGKSIIVYDNEKKENIIIASEGGHCDLAPFSREEIDLFEFIKEKYNKTVIEEEDLVSGKGIENIYEFLTKKHLTAKEISQNKTKDKLAKKTFQMFYTFLARSAKNFALEELSQGGIYIAGGIVEKNINFSKRDFIREFTNNQTFSLMLKDMPIYIITDYNISLYGIANFVLKNKI